MTITSFVLYPVTSVPREHCCRFCWKLRGKPGPLHPRLYWPSGAKPGQTLSLFLSREPLSAQFSAQPLSFQMQSLMFQMDLEGLSSRCLSFSSSRARAPLNGVNLYSDLYRDAFSSPPPYLKLSTLHKPLLTKLHIFLNFQLHIFPLPFYGTEREP